MGGKHKQAQRIKNNARPSSSVRSAELLASSSQAPQSVKEIRFIPPTLSLMKTEEFDSSVSPAFQIVFKKMNKKDCTTKLKALQEFSDLITETEPEAVKTILAFWATLYAILATDTDHRIREAVHNAHHQIILKDKKMIAPFLKQLIGPWFTSQYDNYPPAASAASKAFSAAFPPNKIQDCVLYCQKEIVTYIHDNLCSKVDTNPKHGTNEDAEAKFERIIISSLQGYCLYLDTLTEEQIQKGAELNQQIVTNTRFLKLANHKTPMIRATWFKVLATLYHKAGFLLDDHRAQYVPLVFSNLDESEPAVVGFVWEAAILIMEQEEEWWKHINIEKNYLAKLRKVLREGGQGNATVIYPNLLSFLHKLPSTVRADQFYDSYFENLRLGLTRKSVTASKSESAAVITALVECLQYVILTNHSNLDLCERLIKTQLVTLIEWSLTDEHVAYNTVFNQVAILIQYWSRNENVENYPRYLDIFWTGVRNLFESVVTFEDFELAERHVVLLQKLKTVAREKKHNVKFSTPTETKSVALAHQILDETYLDKLESLVYAVLKIYVGVLRTERSKLLLQHVFDIVRSFESDRFLRGLSRHVTGDDQSELSSIYDDLLRDWLKTNGPCSETIVDLTFLLVKYLSEEEKRRVLTSLLEFSETEIFAWCVKNAFSHPHNEDGIVQEWIRQEKVAKFLIANTERNLRGDCPTNLKSLFKLAFAKNEDGELLIEKDTIEEIVSKLVLPLRSPLDFTSCIDSCVRLASYVSETIYTETCLLKYGEDLLLALFEFSCFDYPELENLTADTRWEIETAWQDAVTTLSKHLTVQQLTDLTGKFADLIEEIVTKSSVTIIEHDIDRMIEVVVNYVKAVFEARPLLVTEMYDSFTNRERFFPDRRKKVSELCLVAEYLKGNFTSPRRNFKTEKDRTDEEDIFRYFVWTYMKISILSSNLVEDEEEMKEIVQAIDDNQLLLAEILFDVTMGESFLDHYKTARYFVNDSRYHASTKNKFKQTIDKLGNYEKVKEVLAGNLNGSETSWLWCKAGYFLCQEMALSSPRDTYLYYFQRATDDLSRLYLIQIYGSCLDYDVVETGGNKMIIQDVVILRNLLHCDEIDVQIAEVFEKIKKLRSKNIPRFLCEDRAIEWEEAEEIIEIVRLFSRLITDKFECLSRQHWDFGVISLSTWSTNCYKFRMKYQNVQFQSFITAISDFYRSLDEKMNELRGLNVKMNFVEEWEDLFLPNIHADLLQLWLYIGEEFMPKKNFSLEYNPFLQEFGKIVDCFHHRLIFSKDSTLPHWSKIIKRCAVLLVNSSSILQLWAYKMLIVLAPGLVNIDLLANDSNTPNTKGLTFEQFKDVLLHTHTIVNDALTGFKLGEDSCQVTPFTDSYTYVFGYLLLWCVLLNLCEKSSPELRYQYAESLRRDNLLKSLLNNLFKLMPTEILRHNEGKAKAFVKLFENQPNLNFDVPCTSEQLEHIVCWVYAFSLSQLPALVRQWWSETETKVTQIVEKVTSFYVSPQLCNQELLDVAHHETKFKNMTIKTIQSVREVIAIYTVDEAQMELVITLPQNYPLGGPDVRCNRQIGGPLHKQWLMQLKKCLLHQNGRIWDGLSLWNSNLDKKFDGVEECYICFAVLHPGTYQLPRLSCQTCKKKFHSACLYKWFSTSNKSSCPICRNLF